MALQNLPALPFDVSKMANALIQSANTAAPSAAFLRMDKQGNWIFGIEAEEIDEAQQFLINPAGFGHGNVCWTDPNQVKTAEKLGETYVPVTEPLPQNGPVPPTGRGWEFQLGMQLKGYKGTQDGVEMVYRTSSVGGKRAVSALSKLVGMKLNAYIVNNREDEIVPIVTLSCDSYPHKKYGKIFVPEINIVKWLKMPVPGAVRAEPEAPVQKRANGKRAR